jgi:hypothetical protein
MINGDHVDASLLRNPDGMLGAARSGSLLVQGSSLLGGLFGADRLPGLSSALSAVTGMKVASAANLVLTTVPILFSALKRFVVDGRLNAGGLESLLKDQKRFLEGRLEGRLTSAMGLGSPASLLAGLGGQPADTARGAAAAAQAVGAEAAHDAAAAPTGSCVRPGRGPAARSAAEKASSMARLWPWGLGAIFALILMRCGTTAAQVDCASCADRTGAAAGRELAAPGP